jgi:PKD domain
MMRERGVAVAGMLLALWLPGLLNGCGQQPVANDQPVADAGGDQNVVLGALVALDGGGSRDPDGDVLSFRWSFTRRPSGSTVAMSNPTSATPTFRPDAVGAYEIGLAVSDGQGDDSSDAVAITVGCDGDKIFDNAEWIVARQASAVPEDPFQVTVNGINCGTAKLLTFASRVTGTTGYPQVFVINSSGYLRIKAGADPSPPIPFGQSLVLGPAITGTSASFPGTTLFFNPQLQSVSIDTSPLNPDGTGTLLIRLVADDVGLPAGSTKSNQIMDMTWEIRLYEPTEARTQADVAGRFTFTEDVTLDSVRTREFQSFRLVQISTLYIDGGSHDVDALRFRGTAGLVHLFYAPELAGMLLPPSPVHLDPANPVFESLHTDDQGAPNGNTPSYRIIGLRTMGTAGPITPRAFFVATVDVNDDNLGAWLHQSPPQAILAAGTTGRIEYGIVATTDPLAAP